LRRDVVCSVRNGLSLRVVAVRVGALTRKDKEFLQDRSATENQFPPSINNREAPCCTPFSHYLNCDESKIRIIVRAKCTVMSDSNYIKFERELYTQRIRGGKARSRGVS
jgi:hypothetical protein